MGNLPVLFKVQHTCDCNVEYNYWCNIFRRSDHIFVASSLHQMQTERKADNIDRGEVVCREENRRDCFLLLCELLGNHNLTDVKICCLYLVSLYRNMYMSIVTEIQCSYKKSEAWVGYFW